MRAVGSCIKCSEPCVTVCYRCFYEAINEAVKQQEKLWKDCKIVYFPKDGSYPIEHNLNSGKDSREIIERHLNRLETANES